MGLTVALGVASLAQRLGSNDWGLVALLFVQVWFILRLDFFQSHK
jgi:hypothetical protein